MTLDDLQKQGGYKVVGYANNYAPPPPPKTFGQHITDLANGAAGLIGGQSLAQGAGMAIAAPYVQNNLATAQHNNSDIALNLTKQIAKDKALGKDTSRLQSAYTQLAGSQQQSQQAQKDFTNSFPTNTQVLGSAARLAGTALAPAIGRGATGLVGTASPGLVSGALHGAGVGAVVGGAEGAIQGGGIAAENNAGAGGIAEGALGGAATGAIAGGALGTVAGGASGVSSARKAANAKFAEDFVAPKETAAVKAEAIKNGRLEDPGLIRAAGIQPSAKDTKIADAVRDVISPKNSLAQNIDAIRHKISTVNNGVKSYIADNKTPFNASQLKTRLMGAKEDSKLIFASDATAERTYDAVVDAFMNNVQKKDTAGLFEARQNFDKIPAIKKLLDSRALGENVKQSIVLDVRRAANEYIADQLPEGNMYRDLLRQESHMIEGLGNAANKGASMIGKNGIQLLTEKYPILKWMVGGLVGAGGIGVGGAIIGSSD